MGGNPAWLQGLHYAPQKLRNLNEINKLLAHRPWLITKEHIEVRADAAGADPPPPPNHTRFGGLDLRNPIRACSSPPSPRFNPFRAEGVSDSEGRVCAAPDGWGRVGEGVTCPPTAGDCPAVTAAGLWGRHIPNTLLFPCPWLTLALGCSGGVQRSEQGGWGGCLSNPMWFVGSAENGGEQLVAGGAGSGPGAPHPLPLARLLRLRLRHQPRGGPRWGARLLGPLTPQQQQPCL